SHSTPQFDPVHAITGKEWSGVVVTFHHRSGIIYQDWAYRVVINWGDGTTSAGTAKLVHLDMLGLDGTFEVQGSHTYAKAGNYQIQVTVDVSEHRFHTEVANSASVKNAVPAELLPEAHPAGLPIIERTQTGAHLDGLPIITKTAALAQTHEA